MDILEKERYGSFRFFLEEANHQEGSRGFGLIRDNTKDRQKASIASVGFGLAAYVIGVDRGYLPREEALRLVKGTLRTFWEVVPHYKGFFAHFVDIDTAEVYHKSEYSTIDTALFLNGAIVADAYFDDSEVHHLFEAIYHRVDWNDFVFDFRGKKTFRMAYNPLPKGDYRGNSDSPWIFQWNMLAEQLSMYFLAAGHPQVDPKTARELFLGFDRKKGTYGPYSYYYSPTNALFIYQFSHAWIDFTRLVSPDGIDWFENSRIATLANKAWCYDHRDQYPTLDEDFWGLTACLTPKGYRNQCIDPNDLNHDEPHVTGVLPPSGPAGSIVFTPEASIQALNAMYRRYPEAFRKYGFVDGILETKEGVWISEHEIGINKGITLLMIDNYQNQTTWKHYLSHPMIRNALDKLGFERKD